MRKSIRKIASLFMAMAMILSVLAMPAFAEERAVHTHSYDTVVDEEVRCTYYDNETHRIDVTSTRSCSCGETFPYTSTSYDSHMASGSGTFAYSITDDDGDTINYYRYSCKVCSGRFVSAG